VEVLRRNLIPIEKVNIWAISFAEQNWQGAYTDEDRNKAFQNTRNLLRSIYLELKNSEGEISNRNELENIFLEVIKNLKPY